MGSVLEGNRFHRLLRYFDAHSSLKSIITVENKHLTSNIEESEFLWKRLDTDVKENTLLQSDDKTRIFIITKKLEGDVYYCESRSPFFYESYYFHPVDVRTRLQ